MKILYLDADPLNRTVGEITLGLEGHTTNLFSSKKQLTPGIENNYDILILDTDAFMTTERTKTTIGNYLQTLSEYTGEIHLVTTFTQRSLETNLGDLMGRVNVHYKPFDFVDMARNFKINPKIL